MKKIENLELKELTLQEAKEVNGGFGWLGVALAVAGLFIFQKLHG